MTIGTAALVERNARRTKFVRAEYVTPVPSEETFNCVTTLAQTWHQAKLIAAPASILVPIVTYVPKANAVLTRTYQIARLGYDFKYPFSLSGSQIYLRLRSASLIKRRNFANKSFSRIAARTRSRIWLRQAQ